MCTFVNILNSRTENIFLKISWYIAYMLFAYNIWVYLCLPNCRTTSTGGAFRPKVAGTACWAGTSLN